MNLRHRFTRRIFDALSEALIGRAVARDPDFVIGGPSDPYLRRWYLVPRNRWLNVYLHNMVRSDDERALHDHPWVNCSILLAGAYDEVVPRWPALWPHCRDTVTRRRQVGAMVARRAVAPHRLVHLGEETWSLFLTGPVIRDWGFWCATVSPAGGWRWWRDFTAGARGETVGAGCGELGAAGDAAAAESEIEQSPAETAHMESEGADDAHPLRLDRVQTYLVQKCAEEDGCEVLATSALHGQMQALGDAGYLACVETPGTLRRVWHPTHAGYALLGVVR